MNYQNINTKDNIEYLNIIKELITNETVKQMQQYRQHYNTSCLEHCIEVSYVSYVICKKLGLDYVAAARAGLLHDLFLYDWREQKKAEKIKDLHAFAHPRIALENALKIFKLNDKEQDMILNHMWPVTFYKLPKYRETYIITLVDKYSALKSSQKYYKKVLKNTAMFKYAYAFFESER